MIASAIRFFAKVTLASLMAGPVVAQDLNPADIAGIKEHLSIVGCYDGPIDNADSRTFREAVGCLQIMAGVRAPGTEDGEITTTLLRRLVTLKKQKIASQGVAVPVSTQFGTMLATDLEYCGHSFLLDMDRSVDGTAHVYRLAGAPLHNHCDETAGFFAAQKVAKLKQIIVYHLSVTDGDIVTGLGRATLEQAVWWRDFYKPPEGATLVGYLHGISTELEDERYLEGRRHAILRDGGSEGPIPAGLSASGLFRARIEVWIANAPPDRTTGILRSPCALRVKQSLLLCTTQAVNMSGDIYCGQRRWNHTGCPPIEGFCHPATGAVYPDAAAAALAICR